MSLCTLTLANFSLNILSLVSLRCLFSTRWLLAGLLASFSLISLAKEKPLTEVADLRYGAALYHYFQNEHFSALSELLVAEQRGGIQGHGDNPEIMMGGFYLAYGLDRTASDIFDRLLDANRPQKTRDAAWYYLSKMRYMRGDWDGVRDALSRIGNNPSEARRSDIRAMTVNLAIKEGRLADAKAIVDTVDRKDDWAPYLYFNFAAALARSGQYPEALTYYQRLERMPHRSEEHLALYDKAMTAAGFANLFSEDYDSAINVFQKVRLNSPMSNRALLGYGWASAEKEDYRTALSPWQVLGKRGLVDENIQEALVAIPYAYEKMGLPSSALKAYRAAEAGYESEIVTIDKFINDLQSEQMLEALNIEPSEDINWLNYAQTNKLAPELTYLTELFSRDSFRGVVQELRDLLVLKGRLTEWRSRIDFYYAMLGERDFNRKQEMDFMARQEAFAELDNMNATRKRILAELDKLERNQDFLAMLSGEQRERLDRIRRAEKNIELLEAAGQDVSQQRKKVIKLRGLLLWDAGEIFAERVWRARKTLSELEQNLDVALTTQVNVQNIVDQGFDLEPYRVRIRKATLDIDSQLANIETAVANSQAVLRTQVATVLEDQRNSLRYYLVQSRLGIVRLLDAASEDE